LKDCFDSLSADRPAWMQQLWADRKK
jgi:hypothetical protein